MPRESFNLTARRAVATSNRRRALAAMVALAGATATGAGESVARKKKHCRAGETHCKVGKKIVCVDVERDPAHCSACNTPCPAGQACCGGHCADLRSDTDNCGACGRRCFQYQSCVPAGVYAGICCLPAGTACSQGTTCLSSCCTLSAVCENDICHCVPSSPGFTCATDSDCTGDVPCDLDTARCKET